MLELDYIEKISSYNVEKDKDAWKPWESGISSLLSFYSISMYLKRS